MKSYPYVVSSFVIFIVYVLGSVVPKVDDQFYTLGATPL